MSEPSVAVLAMIGPVAGGMVVSAFGLLSQRLQHRAATAHEQRSDRRAVYARFLATAVQILFDFASRSPLTMKTVLHVLAEPLATMRERNQRLEGTVRSLGDVMAEVRLIASPTVVVAAEEIAIFVHQLASSGDVSEHRVETAAAEFRRLRNRFLAAARAELGNGPRRWPPEDRESLET